MRVKWPIAGAAFVGAAAVVSYVYNRPTPDAGVVIGLIAVAALVILAVRQSPTAALTTWASNRRQPRDG